AQPQAASSPYPRPSAAAVWLGAEIGDPVAAVGRHPRRRHDRLFRNKSARHSTYDRSPSLGDHHDSALTLPDTSELTVAQRRPTIIFLAEDCISLANLYIYFGEPIYIRQMSYI